MKAPRKKVRRTNVFPCKTGVFEIALIRIPESPVRFQDENVLRNDVYDLPKLCVGLAAFRFRPLARGSLVGLT
jgi:hypothetical protein